jgi:preprotein translocase subunit Sec63
LKYLFSNGFLLKLFVVVLAWHIFIPLGGQVYSLRSNIDRWSPTKVLGLSSWATTSEIRKQYKKLSLRLHPDKRSSGVSKGDAEKDFINLTKAYKMYLVSGFC